MGKIHEFGVKIADVFRKDPNWTRLGRGVVSGAKGIRAGTGTYLTNKVPIVQWIAGYSPKWIIQDIIAGWSVGMVLLPEAVIFSVLAGVPFQQGLISSVAPGVLYAIMGTTKDLSTGPTAPTALLTGVLVADLGATGITPSITAGVLSFGVGMMSLVTGILNLGFLFDLLSLPVILGFSSGLAQVIIILQIPNMLGIIGISPNFQEAGVQIIKKLGTTELLSTTIAAGAIIILVGFQFVWKKWGSTNTPLRIFCQARNFLVIAIFTLISLLVNKNRTPEDAAWQVLGNPKTVFPQATVPSFTLVRALFVPISILFLTTALEHIGIAKSFSQTHGYQINTSQELVFLGVTNIINSFFGGIPVSGGDIGRASVNAASGVISPLGGVLSSVFILFSLTVIFPFVKFLPMPVVAAVILVSTFNQMPPFDYLQKFWRISFVDFLAFFMTFNVTMLAGVLPGLSSGFIITISYTLGRLIFSRPRNITSVDLEKRWGDENRLRWPKEERIPAGTRVMEIETDVIFANAHRVKRHILNNVYTWTFGLPLYNESSKRKWNDHRDKKIAQLRKRADASITDTFIPRMRVLILDISSVSFIDTSGIQALREVRNEVMEYGGKSVQVRFVGMNGLVKRRFERFGWETVDPYQEVDLIIQAEAMGDVVEPRDKRFWCLPLAVEYVPDAGLSELEYEEYDDSDNV